jgi:hypothetical protein
LAEISRADGTPQFIDHGWLSIPKRRDSAPRTQDTKPQRPLLSKECLQDDSTEMTVGNYPIPDMEAWDPDRAADYVTDPPIVILIMTSVARVGKHGCDPITSSTRSACALLIIGDGRRHVP